MSNARASRGSHDHGRMRVLYRLGDDAGTVEVDATFFAVGWPGNADCVDAAAAGVVIERGYVMVDEYTATNVPHIFAAGDVEGNSMVISSATLEGRVAAGRVLQVDRRDHATADRRRSRPR